MDIRLDGKIALITGATGGIGSAIANEFFKSGATIIINGRSQEKIDALTDKILTGGEKKDALRIFGIAMDLTAMDSVQNIIQRSINKYNKLDILVNNAGLVEGKPVLMSDPEFVARVMLVNYEIPYQLTKNALTYMRKARYGRIINITSISGQCGDAGLSVYSSSKAALNGLSQSIAVEYGRYNITANSIAPGIVETNAIKQIREEYKQEVKKSIPCHRFAKPAEIADLATFLASERAAYINGQQIAINGGWYR
ncbi:MAG: SDR family oxidoreductase [Alphaproteobacteria bacterium]|nr:SDR family oxidoreductase [Alphaproteobacteria bacterium]